MLTIRVVPACRSRQKMSWRPFASPFVRLVATLAKATYLPSYERVAPVLAPLPNTPPVLTLSRTVDCANDGPALPAQASVTNTQREPILFMALPVVGRPARGSNA